MRAGVKGKENIGRILALMLLFWGMLLLGSRFSASAEPGQTEKILSFNIEVQDGPIWVQPEDHIPAEQNCEYRITKLELYDHPGQRELGLERVSLENDGREPKVFSVTEAGTRIPYQGSYYTPGTYCFGYTLKIHQPAGQARFEMGGETVSVYVSGVERQEINWTLDQNSRESDGEWDSYQLYTPPYTVKERRVMDDLKLRLTPDPAHIYAGEIWKTPELTVEDVTAHGGEAGSESSKATVDLVYHTLRHMTEGGSAEMARGSVLPEGSYELEFEITDTNPQYRFRWPGTDDGDGETAFWVNGQPCTIQRRRQNGIGRYDLVLSPVTFNLSKRPETEAELRFQDSDTLDIPETVLGNPILPMDVSPYVTGGTKPYRFSGRGLPEGITISGDGIISGTALRAVPAGEAELSVTDQRNQKSSIIIKYGAVKLRESGSDGSGGSSGGGGGSRGGSSGGGGTGRRAMPGASGSTSGQHRDLKTGRWIQDHIGWWYQNADGSYPRAQWGYQQYNGKSYWYYFDERGYMSTGWLERSGSRYYLYPNSDGWKGRMLTGWQWIDGFCYYFETGKQNEGALYLNRQTPDGYTVDAQGRWTVNAVVQKKA